MVDSRSLVLCLLAILCAEASLSSCATRIPLGTEVGSASGTHDILVNLAFVTNRRLESTQTEGMYYGDERGDLSAGRCQVGFGTDDRRGEVVRVDAASIDSVLPTAAAQPFVIYIHGYGESFARSCRRAALLQQRLNLDGRMLLFSWPSSNYLTYAQDAADLEHSLVHLNELLSAAADSAGLAHLILLAHSMGSRGVVDALKQRDDGAGRFAKIVFVAPDMRRDVFLENARMLQSKASDITVYMSDNDRVLWISTTVNASGRLGLAKDIDIDVEHIDLVDISPTGTNNISGHMYHIFNRAVIEDLQQLLGSAAADAERAFRRVPGDDRGLYTLRPVGDGG